jgi:hypothetical protein
MRMLARCSSTEPKTCLLTSKNQIFSGRRGCSRRRLMASEDTARRPSAPWTRRAKSPSRLHSPLPSSPSRGVLPAALAVSEGAVVGTAKAMELDASAGGEGMFSSFAGSAADVGLPGISGSFPVSDSAGGGSALTPLIPRSSVSKTTHAH